MQKIDVFNHIYPPAYPAHLMRVAPDYKDIGKRMRNIPMLADLDVRFRVMDTFDEYHQVLSLPTASVSRRLAPGQGLIQLNELFQHAATAQPGRTKP